MHRRSTPRVASPAPGPLGRNRELARKHLVWCWGSLLVFLTLGVVLEALHGFKVPLYVDVSNRTRRLMWTLAHAHGTILALAHAALAFTLHHLEEWDSRRREAASVSLILAGILIPVGFLLAGAFTYEGDPGIGIVLVPLGAVCLFIAVALAALASVRPGKSKGLRRRPDLKIVRFTPRGRSNGDHAG